MHILSQIGLKEKRKNLACDYTSTNAPDSIRIPHLSVFGLE